MRTPQTPFAAFFLALLLVTGCRPILLDPEPPRRPSRTSCRTVAACDRDLRALEAAARECQRMAASSILANTCGEYEDGIARLRRERAWLIRTTRDAARIVERQRRVSEDAAKIVHDVVHKLSP